MTTGGSTGDPEATASLPADDGTIRVKADGTWSTTLYRVPGDYVIDAWAVHGAGSAATYSVASPTVSAHLTGDPAIAPAATSSELAFTGSQHTAGLGWGGLAALALGGALVMAARRRRRA